MKIHFKLALVTFCAIFPLLNASAQDVPDNLDPVLYIQDDFYRNVKDLELSSTRVKSDRSRARGSGSIKIVSLGEDFKVFLAKAENADPDTQFAAWNELEVKYPPNLVNFIFGADPQGLEAAKRKRLSQFMANLPRRKDKMLRLFDSGPAAIENAFVRFKETFSDYSSDITAYILPLSNFDACAWPGSIAFGAEVLSGQNDGQNDGEKAFTITTTHEVMHTYFYSKTPGELKTFASPLWSEGSAVYVSGRLNPGATGTDMLVDPILAERCTDPAFVKDLAVRYRSIMPKSAKGPEADAIRSAWFKYYKSTPENPSRSAYCLGLQVFNKLAVVNSISFMMTWPETEFSKVMDETLAEIAAH